MKALAPYRSNRGNRFSGALGMVSNITYIPSYLAFSSTNSLSDTTTAKEIDRPNQLRLTVERVRNFSDEINEDSAEELL